MREKVSCQCSFLFHTQNQILYDILFADGGEAGRVRDWKKADPPTRRKWVSADVSGAKAANGHEKAADKAIVCKFPPDQRKRDRGKQFFIDVELKS